MGISYTIDQERHIGNQRVITLTATFDADYTSGGEALSPGDAGLDTIESVLFEEPVTEGGYVVSYRAGDGTIKAFNTGGAGSQLSEVADATDLSTESTTLEVWGRS